MPPKLFTITDTSVVYRRLPTSHWTGSISAMVLQGRAWSRTKQEKSSMQQHPLVSGKNSGISICDTHPKKALSIANFKEFVA